MLALPRDITHHAGRTSGRMNHAGEELERGGLARSVGPEKGDELPLLYLKVDPFGRFHLFIGAVE